MSTDQRASERVGELIHHAFESLLQANTDLERLQDLLGLGMDLKQLLSPHSQTTWKFMVPQEQRFRENWGKFISSVEGAESSASPPQQTAVETIVPVSTPLPAIGGQTAEKAAPITQTENAPGPDPDPPSQEPTSSTSAAPTPATTGEKEQTEKLPPSGSVDNPMEIDDSDDGATVVRGSVAASKRKMKAPPPSGESPGKRRKPMSNRPSGSNDPTTSVNSQVTSVKTAESSKKPSSSGDYTWKPHKDAKIESYGENRQLLHERLDQLGQPFDIDRTRITHDKSIVTRTDIAAIYGGESVASFPKIRKEAQARHPYRNFLHGNFDHNPFMPPEPGWPGLFFRLDEKNDHCNAEGNPILYRTFVRHADKRCVYLGQYTFTRLEDISKQEWRELSDKTKTIWLKFFGATLHGNRSLARIALRASLGGEPTEAQIVAKCESIKPPNIRRSLAEKLQADIRRAFSRGEERIVVWGMKCVSYDYDFENDLATRWQALDRVTPQKSGGTKQSGSQGKGGRRGRRRKWLPVSDESEHEDGVPEGKSRDHLLRKARCKIGALQGDPVSAAISSSEESSDEDEEDRYHDADVGDF